MMSPSFCRIAGGIAVIVSIQCAPLAAAPVQPAFHEVGLAKVDITPDYNIRLSGFASRQTESVGVRNRIFARAMAIRTNGGGEPVVLVAVDSIGVPLHVRNEVAKRLLAKKKIADERFAVSSTHSHTTPAIAKVLPTLFGAPVPPDQKKRIDQYTAELTDSIERAALAALDDLQPGLIAFGIGKVGFAINRRTPGGPVDLDLPVMSIKAPSGKIRGLWVNYACHCVVLSDFRVSGDWAGFAAEYLEKEFPDAVALITIGCGADSNPRSGVTGDKVEIAEQYGQEVAAEAKRLLTSPLTQIQDDVTCQAETISLPLAALPTRDEWVERSRATNYEGYYAKVQLDQLDAGEKLATEVPYLVQTWKFGNTLATVFLPGEVVVDYSLRLKKEFDAARLWVNAYSNDVPCYIPSERVLKEGGYEGAGAMVFYGLPAPFAPGLEDNIIKAVSTQLGDDFKRPAKTPGTQGSLPRSPADSLSSIKVPDGLRVELVASEPMVESPVAIDFASNGKLWVVEMCDYGCKDGETCAPGGRVKVLEDRDADGKFETSTIFLDKIAQPMGITVWRKGVLISAAPDLIYAEDTGGDGKADVVEKLFTGFSVENPQARLNSLAVGLDGWLHAGCMFVGKLRSIDGRELDPGNRDFRLRPDTREIESENGQTENARARDDWGNWFGCENGKLCLHYPLAERYLRRNICLSPPPLDVSVPTPAAAKLIPRGDIVLLPLSGPAGRATAACGLTFYRDELLGLQFAGNVFTCEPVHQLVHRMVLKPKGATFVGQRPDDEADSEFLTSTDNWFRPVQARTGPDGALWIVDMYRYVIEHSRWIPPELQAELDVYAGSSSGRIYRVVPNGQETRSLPMFDQRSTPDLAAAMDSPNGTQRDMIQQQLVWRNDPNAAAPLVEHVTNSKRPAVRLQALCTLDILGKLPDDVLERALRDPHGAVRRHAVRLAESRFKSSPKLLAAALAVADDADPFVVQQLACSLGETDDPRRIKALVAITQRHQNDAYVTTAAWSSLRRDALEAYFRRLVHEPNLPPPATLTKLFELIGADSGPDAILLAVSLPSSDDPMQRLELLQAVLDGLRRNPRRKDVLNEDLVAQLKQLGDQTMRMADDEQAAVATRAKCIRIVGQMPRLSRSVAAALPGYLNATHDAELQRAAIDALAEQKQPDLAGLLIGGWRSFTPALRAHALDVLLTRKEWAAGLLTAIEASTIAASEVDVAHRSRLTEYPDADLRQKAAAILAQSNSSSRAAIVARYQQELKPGDAARGKAVFQKNCAACHKVHNIGTQVGPDIAAREDKSNEGLLREILDPNRAVDQRYADYTAVTTDGVVKNGILTEDTGGAIKLRAQEGQETRLLRSQLESLTSSGKSLMPEGFENQITPAEMSDLLAYLVAP